MKAIDRHERGLYADCGSSWALGSLPAPSRTRLDRFSVRHRHRSSVVEQRFRKPQVDGSSPSVGSTPHPMIARFPPNPPGSSLGSLGGFAHYCPLTGLAAPRVAPFAATTGSGTSWACIAGVQGKNGVGRSSTGRPHTSSPLTLRWHTDCTRTQFAAWTSIRESASPVPGRSWCLCGQ